MINRWLNNINTNTRNNKIPTQDLKVSGITRVYIQYFNNKDIKISDILKCRYNDPDIIVSI